MVLQTNYYAYLALVHNAPQTALSLVHQMQRAVVLLQHIAQLLHCIFGKLTCADKLFVGLGRRLGRFFHDLRIIPLNRICHTCTAPKGKCSVKLSAVTAQLFHKTRRGGINILPCFVVRGKYYQQTHRCVRRFFNTGDGSLRKRGSPTLKIKKYLHTFLIPSYRADGGTAHSTAS